jgi:putative two-component system response regulator
MAEIEPRSVVMISRYNDRKPRIVIIDDEAANISLLKRVLGAFITGPISSTCDPTTAVALCTAVMPDLVLLDLSMPQMDGFAVLSALRQTFPVDEFPAVIVITGDNSAATRNQALSRGARDFIAKPFDFEEVRLRVSNLLETEQLHRNLKARNVGLASSFRDQTMEPEDARIEIVERLAMVAGLRDDVTGQHNHRVAKIAGTIAAEISTAHLARLTGRVAALHDIGKVGIPDSILLKAGPLTDEEWIVMRTHTTIGAQILSSGSSEFMVLAEQIARCHHERWDGTGYPARLKGEEIPLAARIVTIADVFDALSSDRPYRHAYSLDATLNAIEEGANTLFDPELVAVFSKIMARGGFGFELDKAAKAEHVGARLKLLA